MNEELIHEQIIEEISSKYDCHTIILYGSRARGDASEASDYDILAIRDAGPSLRDARLWQGVYLDIFVHSKSVIDQPPAEMLEMRHGKILREKEDTAKIFFSKLEEIYQAGPKKLPPDEIKAIVTWHVKAIDRIRLGGMQGLFRRSELLPALLEHYFTTRGHWYRGPKASFHWLEKNRPDLFEAFQNALNPSAANSTVEKLVLLVNQAIEKEGQPEVSANSATYIARPDYIKHWTEVQDPDNSSYPKSTELLSIGSALGKKLGLTRIGIHHEFLPPGRRTSWPHAESSEEEFGFVIEGHPDVWIDGHLHRLSPGDAVAFPAATGIAHTFINNSDQNARLIIVGEASKPENKVYYPLHPELKETRKDWWNDAPKHPLGAHDGRPDRRRNESSLKKE